MLKLGRCRPLELLRLANQRLRLFLNLSATTVVNVDQRTWILNVQTRLIGSGVKGGVELGFPAWREREREGLS